MYSILAFLLTFIEIAAAAGGYLMDSQLVFSNVVVYGSPFYLMMGLVGSGSALTNSNPIYLLFFLYHIIKYFCIFRAQAVEDGNLPRTLSVLFEIAYLGISAYYLY